MDERDRSIDTPDARAHLLQLGRRVAFPLPDALLAVIYTLAVVTDFLSPQHLASLPGFPEARVDLLFALVVEGGFLMMQGTLVDIATRLRKRPPVWLIVIIVVGVLLFSGEAMSVLRMAWERGLVVFIPLLFSLGQRATLLWHLPTRRRVEKIAARALISNRITTGLVLFALVTVAMIAGTMFRTVYGASGAWPMFAAGAIYFAVAAYDDARVRGRRFAEQPRVLFRFDPLGATYLDPI